MTVKVAVIGSGHAGMAAASALVERGIAPEILDVGETPPERVNALVTKLAEADSAEWTAEDLRRAKPVAKTQSNGALQKLYFGSDYFYAQGRPYARSTSSRTAAAQSFARGGFSVAWGGCMLPACDRDISDWPIATFDLAPHYRAALAEMPLSAREDGLTEWFPLYTSSVEPIEITRQSAELLRDLASMKPGGLRNDTRLIFGQSRLAVRARNTSGKPGCRYCGICLAGCPYGALYTANERLDQLIQRSEVNYRPGICVHSVSESDDGVELNYFDLNETGGKKFRSEKFSMVFVAAGAIGTARIAMQSLELYDQPVAVKDSSKFAIPLIRAKSTPIEWPLSNTYPSVFIEALFEDLSPHPLHMQVSSTNDIVLNELKALKGRTLNGLGLALAPILKRLMVAFCSVHSDHSGELQLTLSKGTSPEDSTLSLNAQESPDNREFIRKLCWRLVKAGYQFNTQFVAPLTKNWEPGLTGQCGGSFPMRRSPAKPLDTDILGRPAGKQRTYFVDASVFPSIPGPTIGLTIMANARRIATLAPV